MDPVAHVVIERIGPTLAELEADAPGPTRQIGGSGPWRNTARCRGSWSLLEGSDWHCNAPSSCKYDGNFDASSAIYPTAEVTRRKQMTKMLSSICAVCIFAGAAFAQTTSTPPVPPLGPTKVE